MLKPQILIFAILLALAAAPASAKTYKCKDDKGKTYYTDRPPAQCLGKDIEELSKRGTVVNRQEAALTPEQIAEREADEKREKEEQLAAKELRRKNRALLTTYESEKDIDDSRERALKQVELASKEIEKRIAAAEKRSKQLEAEKEFYLKKPMPKKIKDNIRNNELELKTQQNALAGKQKEIDEINAKYDEDKRRYLELTRAKPRTRAKN